MTFRLRHFLTIYALTLGFLVATGWGIDAATDQPTPVNWTTSSPRLSVDDLTLNGGTHLRFVANNTTYLVVEQGRTVMDPPKRIRVMAAVPDDTELCLEPSAGAKEICLPLKDWRAGLAQE